MLERCWPEQGSAEWTVIILLALSLLQAQKGKENACQAGIILWHLTEILLFSMLLSAVPEIRVSNLRPLLREVQWKGGLKLLTVLFAVQAIDGEEKAGEKERMWKKTGVLAILASLCAGGVMGGETAAMMKAPFYELSRSIRLYGTFERMESLAWTGLLLGAYISLSYLLTAAEEAAEPETLVSGYPILNAVVIYTLYILERKMKGGGKTEYILIPVYLLYKVGQIAATKRKMKKI